MSSIKIIRRFCIVLVAVMLIPLFSVLAQAAPDQDNISNQQILILCGFQYGIPVADAYIKSMVDSLKAEGIPVNNIHVTFLDLNRNDTDRHRFLMQEILAETSRGHHIDLIIATDQVAADFMVKEAKDLFEGVPLVVSYDEEPAWEGAPRNLIIAAASDDVEGTVRYAFELFPNTKKVVIIMGADDEKAPFIDRLIAALESLNKQVGIEKTRDLTYAAMLEQIAVLPPDTIVFYGSYFQDISGETFVPAVVANTVGQVANAPVFAFIDMHIQQGLVGGSVVITEKLGQQVAQAAVNYFTGTLVLNEEPIRIEPDFYPLFNWQQLKQFGANPNLLPENTVFLNKSPTLWDEYKELIITAAFLLAGLAMLSIILIMRNRQLGRAREELLMYSETLNERVAERTAQLEAKNRELETFTYSVSHDLKAPLRGIEGYSRLLLTDHAENLNREGRAFLQTIRRSAGQMSSLIDDLLTYSRLEQRPWQQQAVSLQELVSSYLAEPVEEIAARGGSVEIDLPEITIYADRDGLALALRNLLDNAAKYCNKTEAPAIRISGLVKERSLIIMVSDNGIGFDMQYHDRIFGIFNRLHPEGEYSGTGIGLAMVKKALERMGGRVWAESAPGKGSTFYLEIPLTGSDGASKD